MFKKQKNKKTIFIFTDFLGSPVVEINENGEVQ